jgi:hypothetical protein
VRVVLLATAVALGGCGVWYRPVPIATAIGKQRAAVGADSFHVHRDPRFEIYGPGSRPVFDAYEQLNRMYRSFDRYFGTPAQRLIVVLYPEGSKPRDSAAVQELRTRGVPVLRFVRPQRAAQRERIGEEGYAGSLWPVGPTATRLLLASFASPGGDTASLAILPAWYRAAVMNIVGDGSTLATDVQFVKESRGNRQNLEALVTVLRPTTSDSTLDPYRRDDADYADRVFAAHSSALLQFIAEREGVAAVASLGRAFAQGETFLQAAAMFKTLPKTLPELDERWAAWLAVQKGIW